MQNTFRWNVLLVTGIHLFLFERSLFLPSGYCSHVYFFFFFEVDSYPEIARGIFQDLCSQVVSWGDPDTTKDSTD